MLEKSEEIMKKFLSFIKNEVVMLVSLLLAVLSMFFVAPSSKYINYIDFRTLTLLFCLMTVMAGFNRMGLFKIMAEKLLGRAKQLRVVIIILVLLCFFSSMIITNDVALITFVPFTIVTLKLAEQGKMLIFTVTLETAAANLGSMLTPIGNPQNLYLFSVYDMSITEFFRTIFPYALLSLVMLIAFTLFSGKYNLNLAVNSKIKKPDTKLMVIYFILFALSLLGVFRALNYIFLLIIVVTVVALFDRKSFLKVDYSLTLTFVFLFIFIGNLGNIPIISKWLSNTVNGNEVIAGVLTSQVFSNVPAAVLLSGFTQNANSLLIGVNLGGLGTLIASMASLISFKFIQKEKTNTAKYLLVFTVVNIIFLAMNLVLWLLIRQ